MVRKFLCIQVTTNLLKPSGLLLLMFGYKCDLWVVFKEVVADYTKVVFDNGGQIVTLNNMQVTINVIKNSKYPT